jgi:hypothetical protein
MEVSAVNMKWRRQEWGKVRNASDSSELLCPYRMMPCMLKQCAHYEPVSGDCVHYEVAEWQVKAAQATVQAAEALDVLASAIRNDSGGRQYLQIHGSVGIDTV